MTTPVAQPLQDIMGWYYNSNVGSITHVPRATMTLALHAGLGWHGPFDTEQQAKDYYLSNVAKNPGWKAPTGVSGQIDNAIKAPGEAIGNALDPFKNLNLQSWLIRIGEIVLGIVLIAVGLARLTGYTNYVAGLAKTAVKSVPGVA